MRKKGKIQGYSCELKDDLKTIIKKDEIESWRTTNNLKKISIEGSN